MGKRKLHGQTYYQCDWTGLPMRQTNAYMPTWNEAGKLVKHGSYTCWEAVISHAFKMHEDGGLGNEDNLIKIQEHINEMVGCVVLPAPSYSLLNWFGGGMTTQSFMDVINNNRSPVTAVCMTSDGKTHEVLVSKEEQDAKFHAHLTKPFQQFSNEPQSFQTVRKKANKDRDLTVFYWPSQNGLPFNQTASNMFKMQIYGDVVIVQQTKEPCFMPRERYVNYYLTTFNEQLVSRKRKEPCTTLTQDNYQDLSREMQGELQALEARSSSSSLSPSELAKGSVCPPPSGPELASLVTAQGHKPPSKKKARSIARPTSFEQALVVPVSA